MGRLRLKSCEYCGAITHKDDAAFHAQYHVEQIEFRAWVERFERTYTTHPALVKSESGAQPEESSTGCLSSPSQAVQAVQSSVHLE